MLGFGGSDNIQLMFDSFTYLITCFQVLSLYWDPVALQEVLFKW